MNNLSFVNANDKDFIEKLKEIVLSNLSDENFGVEELVAKSGLSSSIVRHRIKIITQKTISQFINEVRLNKALEILRNDSLTASEVAYQVGFSSPAYFNNCFHDYYGYPPGEAKKRLTLIQENHKTGNTAQTDDSFKNRKHPKRKIRQKIFKPATIIAVIGILLWLVYLTFYDSSFQVLGMKLSKEEKSIAVLPFENLSNGDENQHFAKGVTDKILSNLSQISVIKVISDPVKVNAEDLKKFEKIARKSGIRFILTGSVQRSGDSIQIIPKLTDLNNNQLKWSDTYSEKWSNIFQVQSKIAIQVASELHAIISKNEKAQIEKIPTTSQEAYNYYLTGRFLLENRPNRDEDTNRYLTPFKKAISADNNYAEAYAGLADVYLTITGIQCYPQPQGFNLAKKNIQRAIELDPDLAEVHFTLGRIYRYEWKWEEARKELEIAMKLNPQNADFCYNYAQLMYYFRNYEAYKFYTIKAAELNPVSSKLILSKAYMYREEGNFEKALEDYNRYIEINPDVYSGYYNLWELYRKTGEDSSAVKMLQKSYSLLPSDQIFSESIPSVFKEKGLKGVEQTEYEYMIQSDLKGSWRGLARYCVETGDKEKALYWIEKAWEWDVPNLPCINGDRGFDPIRNEPRFQAVINKMGLTKYQ